ncbi:hypothetical protein ACTXM3_08435 [Glutamicibacter arilaitensis]|uniref:hypothetical protein n=1 Tax=Glutamicibacter arilaitensis TaxID=256701 RepID=UPI003FD64A69
MQNRENFEGVFGILVRQRDEEEEVFEAIRWKLNEHDFFGVNMKALKEKLGLRRIRPVIQRLKHAGLIAEMPGDDGAHTNAYKLIRTPEENLSFLKG